MKRNSYSLSLTHPTLEKTINFIFNSLKANAEDPYVVVKSNPNKGAYFCKGIINIFHAEEIEKAKHEEHYKPRPLESFSFYASTHNPAMLGSVSIYGDKPYTKYIVLKKRGYLFGRKILQLSLKQGMKPFVDVTLAY